jgi:ADP-heptose:LPS heptosyltransferase
VRILIYRLGSLGDTVIALPCFRLIRSRHPEAEITVLTNLPVSGKAAAIEAVLENTGLVDRFIPYPVGLRDPKKLGDLRRQIAAEKFDLAISLTAARGLVASIRDYLFFRACGIPRIVGIPWRPRDLAPAPVGGGLYENEASRLLRRVGWKHAAEPVDGRNLALTVDEHAQAGRLLEERGIRTPFIAASIGTKSPLNDWGPANWRELLARLGKECPDHGLVLLGSPDESARSADLAKAWLGPSANLCGVPSPRVSAALFAQARLFLGHDSGPMHLAAAAGAPVVGIFSARCRPGQWFPGGPHTIVLYPHAFFDLNRVEDADHQRAAIGSITVDAVLEAAKSCLSAAPSPKVGGTP